MLWELLLASVVGFLAVVPLAQDASLVLPTTPHTWAISTIITGCLLIFILTFRLWQGYRGQGYRGQGYRGQGYRGQDYRGQGYQGKVKHSPTLTPVLLLKRISWHGSVSLLTVLTSSSYGLYHYYHYQQNLLTEPITITAQISSQQISDTISKTVNQTVNQQNMLNNQTPIQIGTGYQRQIWQIDKILPLESNTKQFLDEGVEDEAENLTPPEQDNPDLLPKKLPLKVLVTADLNRHPYWQTTLDSLAPSDHLTVKLALQPIAQPISQPMSHLSQDSKVTSLTLGFDESAWLRQRGVQATAQLLAIEKKPPTTELSQSFLSTTQQAVEKLRWQFRQKILTHLTHQLNVSDTTTPDQHQDQIHASAILLGLLTGDRGLMDSEIKHTYQVTGISHLLAISGPHVMMLASFIAFMILAMVKRFFPHLLLRVPARLLVLWVSVGVSVWYALLVGFELPAQRTVWMLLLVTLSVQWLLPLSAYRVLAGVGLFMLWLDTTAVTQAGFWLSFVAVGLLLKFSQNFQNSLELENVSQLQFKPINQIQPLEPSFLTRQTASLWHAFKQLLWLQLWLFVLMMPVVVWFFGKISFLSVVVNLVAVPLLGLVVVPLDMLAGVLSFLPVIGTWASDSLWQGLSWGLISFHHGLVWLIDHGFAKQGYLNIRPSQLILLVLIIGLILSPKGLLPRLLALPLLLATVAIDYSASHDPHNGTKLIVLDNTKLSISLWIKDDTAWLILADNRYMSAEKPDNKFTQKPKIVAKPTDPNEVLEQSIYPLLANHKVNKLAGIVSQTPSPTVNAVVQNLSKEATIEQYWLAGFDPLIPNAEFTTQGYDFSHITPQPCQAGQHIDRVTAITGWRLNQNSLNNQLPKALSAKENWQTQTCFIQIDAKKSVLLMAGDSQIPLQMSEQLCTVKPVSLMVAPYITPFTPTWLSTTQPKQLHLITGKYANQQLPEDSQYAIADMPNLEVYQSGEQGDLIYNLD